MIYNLSSWLLQWSFCLLKPKRSVFSKLNPKKYHGHILLWAPNIQVAPFFFFSLICTKHVFSEEKLFLLLTCPHLFRNSTVLYSLFSVPFWKGLQNCKSLEPWSIFWWRSLKCLTPEIGFMRLYFFFLILVIFLCAISDSYSAKMIMTLCVSIRK